MVIAPDVVVRKLGNRNVFQPIFIDDHVPLVILYVRD